MSSLVRRLREVADTHADLPALSGPEEEVWSYRELFTLVARRAGSLKSGNSLVGLPINYGYQMVVNALSLVWLGRPFLGIEQGWSESYRKELLQKTGVRAVLMDFELGHAVDPTAEDASLLCLLSTSGTTGEPKLVPRTHGSVFQNLREYREACRIESGDRVALLARPTHGTFISQLIGGLLGGACLYYFDLKESGPGNLALWLIDRRITHLHLAPGVYRTLTETLREQNLRVPGLKTMRLGGGSVEWEDVCDFQNLFSGVAVLLNGYSSSEAAGNICCHRIDFANERGRKLPVGRPVAGRTVSIRDERGNRLPPGEVGRVVVGSESLAGSYWQDSELTASTFRKGEWWSDDLGYLDADGVLYLTGRRDSVVKILGSHVDLGRARDVLSSIPGVSAVDCRKHGDGLIALLQAEVDGGSLDERARALLNEQSRTPLPWRIEVVPSIATWSPGEETGEEGDQDPYCRTLSEILRRPVKVGDNFFQLGGTSLIAAEWVQRLAVQGIRVSPVEIAAALTVGELARGEGREVLPLLRLVHGTEPVLFIPGGAGDGLEFLAFASVIRAFGLTVIGLAPMECGSHQTLDQMLRACFEKIQGQDISILLGWCSGARVTLELAERLKAAGRSVSVVLVDPPPPDSSEMDTRMRHYRGIGRGLWASVGRLGSHFRKLTSGPLRSRTRHANHLLRAANLVMRGLQWNPPGYDTQEYWEQRKAYSALIKERPWGRYGVPVVLHLTADRRKDREIWRRHLIGSLEVQLLTGHHTNFYLEHLEANLPQLIRSLERNR